MGQNDVEFISIDFRIRYDQMREVLQLGLTEYFQDE